MGQTFFNGQEITGLTVLEKVAGFKIKIKRRSIEIIKEKKISRNVDRKFKK